MIQKNSNKTILIIMDEKSNDFVINIITVKDLELSKTYGRSICNSNQSTICRDLIWPQTIIMDVNTKIDDFIFSIAFGTVNIQIPIDFLIKMFPPKIIGSKYHISIPKKFLLKQHIAGYGDKKDRLMDYARQEYISLTGKNETYEMADMDQKYIDLMNRNNLHGIPIRTLNYQDIRIRLFCPNLIKTKYELEIEIIELKFDNPLLKYTIKYNVNLIHMIDQSDYRRFYELLEKYGSFENYYANIHSRYYESIDNYFCSCAPDSYKRWALIDLTYLINCIRIENAEYVCRNMICIKEYRHEVLQNLVEKNTKIIKPICQMIVEYLKSDSSIMIDQNETSNGLLGDFFPDTYIHVKNQDRIAVYIFINNSFIVNEGMCATYKKCDKSLFYM